MSAAKHGVSFVIIAREPNVWQATCTCRERWTAPTYEAAEDRWREHIFQVKGFAPKPMGDKTNRWEPKR
jgi:hypothetical protein